MATSQILNGKLLGNKRILKPFPWYLACGLTNNDVIAAYNCRVGSYQAAAINIAHRSLNTLEHSVGYPTYNWYYDYGWVCDGGVFLIPSITIHQDMTIVARFDRCDLYGELFGVKNNGNDFFFDYPDIGYRGHVGSVSWQRDTDDTYFTMALNKNGIYKNGTLYLASPGGINSFSYVSSFAFGGYYDEPTHAVVPNLWETRWIAVSLYNKILTPDQIRVISQNMINLGPNYDI